MALLLVENIACSVRMIVSSALPQRLHLCLFLRSLRTIITRDHYARQVRPSPNMLVFKGPSI